MLTTTTPTVQGHEIKAYHGIVVGEAILGANFLKDFFGKISDVIGGRSGSYEREMRKARRIAMDEIEEQAHKMGANAIVGIDIDYEVVGPEGSMMMVSVSGTAVSI